jgi:phage gpG-like protein
VTGTRIETRLDDAAVQAAFRRLIALASDPAPTLREIGQNLVEMRRARFIRGQGPNRVPWRPKQPRRDGKDLPLLVSGRLRDSLAVAVDGNTVLVGTDLPYAAIHEFGGEIRQYAYSRKVAFRSVGGRSLFARSRGKGAHKKVTLRAVTYGERLLRIPARPFLGADDEDRDEIQDVVARHIARISGGGA